MREESVLATGNRFEGSIDAEDLHIIESDTRVVICMSIGELGLFQITRELLKLLQTDAAMRVRAFVEEGMAVVVRNSYRASIPLLVDGQPVPARRCEFVNKRGCP